MSGRAGSPGVSARHFIKAYMHAIVVIDYQCMNLNEYIASKQLAAESE